MYNVGDKIICYNNVDNEYNMSNLTIDKMYTIIGRYKNGIQFSDNIDFYGYCRLDRLVYFFHSLKEARKIKLERLNHV